LVLYSDSVYKTPKTHFDLLLLKLLHGGKLMSNVNTKEKGEGFMSHLYSTLGCCGRGGKKQRRRKARVEASGKRMTRGRSCHAVYRET
jgi:hypothetical protein